MKIALKAFAAGLALVASATAQATLIGDTVTCGPVTVIPDCLPSTTIVTPATEFTAEVAGTPFLAIDVGGSSLHFQALRDFSFSLTGASLLLGSLDDPAGDIVGITNFLTSDTTGIDASDVTFTAHSVSFNIDDSSWLGSGRASFDLVVRAAPAAVSEPPSIALMALALAAFAPLRKKSLFPSRG